MPGWLGCPALICWNDGVSDLSDLGGGGGEGQHELVSARHVLFILVIMIAILKYTTWCHFSEGHCSRTAPQRHIYTRNSSDEGVGLLLIIIAKQIMIIAIITNNIPEHNLHL